jgi:hypothetical protein
MCEVHLKKMAAVSHQQFVCFTMQCILKKFENKYTSLMGRMLGTGSHKDFYKTYMQQNGTIITQSFQTTAVNVKGKVHPLTRN